MEIKLWNGTYTKHISFKWTDNKVKLGNLHFNNVKNVEARYEVLEEINVMDNFIVGEEMQTMKDHLLSLIVEDKKLHVAIEKVAETEW